MEEEEEEDEEEEDDDDDEEEEEEKEKEEEEEEEEEEKLSKYTDNCSKLNYIFQVAAPCNGARGKICCVRHHFYFSCSCLLLGE